MNIRQKLQYLPSLTVVTIAALTTILFYFHPGARELDGADYSNDIDNPFHEAVVLYFHDRKDDAKRLLLRLARQDKYTAQAYINYGLFCERERDYSEAGNYYRKALARGENFALFYLINLHTRLGTELPGHAFTAAGNLSTPETGCWVEYRKAEERLQKNDRDGALDHLKKSVDLGLPLVSLVYWDPLFKQLHEDRGFKELLARARGNNSRHRTMTQQMEIEEFNHFKNSPFGMAKELMKVVALETKDEAKAEEMLLPLLTANLGVRDRAITLYWLARIRARKKDMTGAGRYLSQFKTLIRSGARDTTGFIGVVRKMEDDLYANDPLLKNIH